MAYDSYKLLHSQKADMQDKMMYDKKKQIDFLFHSSFDREKNCTIENRPFSENPRIFNRKIKTSYYQSLICETIAIEDRFRSGNILYYDNDYWICTSSFVFHNLYCKGNFLRTNYTLIWQNQSGNIIKKRCWAVSAAQYNSGESGNKTMTLGSDQMMLVLPSDNDTDMLDTPQRFFIDKNKVNPTPYIITRNDSVPYSDWDDGCINLIVTQVQTNHDNDKLVTLDDGSQVWICDYRSPTTSDQPSNPEQNPILCKIEYSSPTVKIGSRFKTFKGVVTDMDGNPVSDTGVFSIVSTFNDRIITDDSVSNQLKVKVPSDCASLAWKTFDLIFTVGTASDKLTITIEE